MSAIPDLESREAYRRLVFSLATGEPPAPAPARPPARIPLAQSLRATRLGFRRCWYSSHEGCGCSGTHCYHQARIVGLQDCVTCLSPLASNSR